MDIVGMLSDSYALFKGNRISYESFLNTLARLLRPSDSTSLLRIVSEIISDFSHICKSKRGKMPNPIVEKYLGHFDFKTSDPTIRSLLLTLGNLIEVPSYLAYSLTEWDRFVEERDTSKCLSPIITYGVEVRNGFSLLNGLLRKSLSPQGVLIETGVLIEAMSRVQTQAEYIAYLDMHKGKIVSDQNKTLLFTFAGENRLLNYLLWPYIRDNWSSIYEQFGVTQFSLVNIIMSMRYLSMPKDVRDEMKTFIVKKKVKNIVSTTNTLLELIEINWNINQNININIDVPYRY